MSEKPIRPLRRRMIEDMTVRNFVEKTRNDYIRHVRTAIRLSQRSRGARTSPASILCHHPIAPRTIIGRAFDRMFDSTQKFFAVAVNFAVLPAVCSDRIGEPISLIIALV